jgi:hypothetical protein
MFVPIRWLIAIESVVYPRRFVVFAAGRRSTAPKAPDRTPRAALIAALGDSPIVALSINLSRHSHGYLINNSSGVPVCQADAPVASRTADRVGAVGAVNANPFFVQTNPDDPD